MGLALLITAGCGHPAAHPAGSAPTTATSAPTPARPPCPTEPEHLTPSMAAAAFAAVVRDNKRDPSFRPGTLRNDKVLLAPQAGARGQQVAVECGPAVAARTFVVMTTRTDLLPNQSASQGVYFVSRVAGQFVVWQQAH